MVRKKRLSSCFKADNMLELNVERLVRMHGADHQQAFLISRGLSAREARTVSNPKEIRQVRDSLLQRLCEGLLCTPNDVFVWRGGTESVLQSLNKGAMESLGDRLQREQNPKEVERLVQQALKVLEEEPVVTRMHGGRLRLNVRRLLEQKGVKRLHHDLMGMGFSHGEAAGLLGESRMAIKLPLLARVCEAFHCLPNDVYDFDGPEGHVLQALRKEPVVKLDARLEGLTEAQLRRVLEAMR